MVAFLVHLDQKDCQEKKAPPAFLGRQDRKDKRASQELMDYQGSLAKMDYPAYLASKEKLAMACLDKLDCLEQKEKQDFQAHLAFLDKKENLDQCLR